jgi:hypothetical protein
MRGLPIGHGEVWHDPEQRRMLIGMAALAMVPFLGLMLPGWGLTSFDGYFAWLAAPAIGLLTALAAFSWQRYPVLFKRLGIGAIAGLMGALAYDTIRIVGEGFGWFSAGSALGLQVMGAGLTPSWQAMAENTFIRWVVLGALWGLAYGLVAGKASWAYGVATGLWLGGVTLLASWIAPNGSLFGPAMTIVGTVSWLVGAGIFGAVMGGLNEALQPDTRFSGKIIFLRDYQTRVHQRK